MSDNYMRTRLPFFFQVQTAVKRQWIQFKIQWDQRRGVSNPRRSHFRAAAAAAAAAEAEAGDIPVYICHQAPKNNEPAINLGEEGAEDISMEIIEQESCA